MSLSTRLEYYKTCTTLAKAGNTNMKSNNEHISHKKLYFVFMMDKLWQSWFLQELVHDSYLCVVPISVPHDFESWNVKRHHLETSFYKTITSLNVHPNSLELLQNYKTLETNSPYAIQTLSYWYPQGIYYVYEECFYSSEGFEREGYTSELRYTHCTDKKKWCKLTEITKISKIAQS